MQFLQTPLPGVMRVALERHADQRGFFARTWCAREFSDHGLAPSMVQASVSENHSTGTVRGLHFQWPPSHEAKLVRCEQGSIFDAIVDLRPGSPSFLQCFTAVLKASSGDAVYIPPGCAHGYQTLEDRSRIAYLMSDVYQPELAGGFRPDDPAFAIAWPLPVSVISDRDRSYPDFDQSAYVARFQRGSGTDPT